MPNYFLRAVIFDFGGTLMYGRNAWDPFIAQADEALTLYLRSQGMELNLSTFPLQKSLHTIITVTFRGHSPKFADDRDFGFDL